MTVRTNNNIEGWHNGLHRRLLAVPFKIVAKAREIAERKRKTAANERRERGGEAGSLFSCFSPCSSLAALCALGSHALATI